jgi:cephalosporin-C deacetylase
MVVGPEPPEDLVEFWTEATEQALHAPLDYRRDLNPELGPTGHIIETLRFRGIAGENRFGWIAYPPDARRLPGFLWVAPYGRESKLPDQYGTRPGFVSLSFNFFGHQAMHIEKYVPDRGYFAEGASSPETWIFRQMFQDAVIATRVMQAQFEIDEERIGAMGMSQGGGISIWLGAWCPIVRSVCADMPFLGNVLEALNSNVYRYPMKELVDYAETLPVGMAQVGNTVSYFDTVVQARHCKVPTLVSLGLRDPASRPDTVRQIIDALPGTIRKVEYPGGHDWDPEMVENNRRWLADNLR